MAQQDRLGCPVHEVAEDVEIQRLLDEVVGAALQRRLGRRHVAVGRDHDRLRVALVLLGELQDLEARRLVLHHQIGDDHIEAAVHQFILGLGQAVDDGADVPGLTQRLGHDLGVLNLVVDNQDLRGQGVRVRVSHERHSIARLLAVGQRRHQGIKAPRHQGF